MPSKPNDTPIDPEAELSFSGCRTIRDCFDRVTWVLQHANDVHQKKCSTRKRARNLLASPSELKHADMALILALAVFPEHGTLFDTLKIALLPDGVNRLRKDPKKLLINHLVEWLQAKKHNQLITILGLS